MYVYTQCPRQTTGLFVFVSLCLCSPPWKGKLVEIWIWKTGEKLDCGGQKKVIENWIWGVVTACKKNGFER